jgi:hypothetical protein
MIDHRRFLDLVAASIDFELSAAEHDLLADHMASCRACRREAEGFRQDAVAIAAFPEARLAPDVAAAVLERVLRPPARSRLVGRLVLAALVALLAVAAAAVGAGLVREWRDGLLVVPPPLPSREVAIASGRPSAEPSPTASVPPSPAPAPPSASAPTWTVSSEAGVDLKLERPTAVAAGSDVMVAVGGLSCTVDSDGNGRCWAQTARSVDGVTWTAIPSTDATEVGPGPTTEGPIIGMNDIAGGDDGFIAIGYVALDTVRAAVWRNPEGTKWERVADDPVFDDAHLSTVARTPYGWFIGGAVNEPDGPRAAIWSSPDGRVWQRAPDSTVFDVGGYMRTLTVPFTGGIRDIAVRDDTIVAVGHSRDANGENVAPAVWSSADGQSWERQTDVGASAGSLTLVGSVADGFVAVRWDCSVEPCTSAILDSPDGVVWRDVSTDGFPERSEPRAVANVEGTIALGAVEDGRLKILASVDGRSWSTVHEVTWKTSDGASPKPELVNVNGLGMATGRDGSATIVGWTAIDDDQAAFTEESFSFEIKR